MSVIKFFKNNIDIINNFYSTHTNMYIIPPVQFNIRHVKHNKPHTGISQLLCLFN